MDKSTSLYLDLIRPLAALIVLLSHISFYSLSDGQLGYLSGTGKGAVDVFFVLSGFVIAHVYYTREKNALDYTISRLTRIYSVVIPTLILVAILDHIGMKINPHIYGVGEQGAQEWDLGLIIRSLLFLGEQWNSHYVPGADLPYWSLGFEVWYYIIFGIFVFAPVKWRWIASIATLIFIGPKVAVMFPLWLMGIATYYFCNSRKLKKSTGWMLFVASIILAPIVLIIFYPITWNLHIEQFDIVTSDFGRIIRIAEDNVIAMLFSVHLIGFYTVSSAFYPLLKKCERPIRWVSNATFSIYLAHLPIMYFFAAISPWPLSSRNNLCLLIVGTLLACVAFAEVSERRKAFWRGIITALINRIANVLEKRQNIS